MHVMVGQAAPAMIVVHMPMMGIVKTLPLPTTIMGGIIARQEPIVPTVQAHQVPFAMTHAHMPMMVCAMMVIVQTSPHQVAMMCVQQEPIVRTASSKLIYDLRIWVLK